MTPAPRRTLALAAAVFLVSCSEPAPRSEHDVVKSSYEARLLAADPDLAAIYPHVAWLGQEALDPVLAIFPSSTGVKRRKLALLLEVMAWNGIRSPKSVAAIAGASAEKDAVTKEEMINALFWSTVDPEQFPDYWDPRVKNREETTPMAKVYGLPFGECRRMLGAMKLDGFLDANGNLAGDAGRPSTRAVRVLTATSILAQVYRNETNGYRRVFGAIQALRVGDKGAIEALITILQPQPNPSPETTSAADRARRALQEGTGKSFQTWEEWVAWWKEAGPKRPPARNPVTSLPIPLKPGPGTPKVHVIPETPPK